MLKTILVPLDGSLLSARALPFATYLARHAHARLLLLRAYQPLDDALDLRAADPSREPAEREHSERQQAEAGLLATADRLRQADLVVETVFVEGAPAAAIADQAQATAADLIVMSTHGRGGLGRWLYGSVADEVLRTSERPVLLVSAAIEHQWPAERPLRVLVALDGSALAAEALGPASTLASAVGGAELLLVGVVEPDTAVYPDALVQFAVDVPAQNAQAQHYLERVAESLRDEGRPTAIQVGAGEAASTIVRIAREREMDVIAMATHGRSGVARFVLGSVATRTLQRSGAPLLLVRPAAVRPAAEPGQAEQVPAALSASTHS